MEYKNISFIKNGQFYGTGDFIYEDACLTLELNQEKYKIQNTNAFDGLIKIRQLIYPLIPQCMGAAIDVYPSGMSRDMAQGRIAYQTKFGESPSRFDHVNIFDTVDINKLATVEEQKKYHSDWLDSRVYYDPKTFFIDIDEKLVNKYKGSLLGLACGDALGTTLEFKAPSSFKPISDMLGEGPFKLQAGQWTDDTSMALCLSRSLIDKKGFDATDQMNKYVMWYKNGYLSSTGHCFDIGNTTRDALERFIATNNPFSGSSDPFSAGNGSLMRVAPIALFFLKNPSLAISKAGESSKTTHGALEAIEACRYFTALLLGILQGFSKKEVLSESFCMDQYSLSFSNTPKINEIVNGSYKRKSPPDIEGSGYVIKSLEAALWAFYNSSDFKEGCLLAANLGDDADTTSAIYGQLAGAFYGKDGIPQSWRSKVFYQPLIESFAIALYRLANHQKETSSKKIKGLKWKGFLNQFLQKRK